MKHQLLLMCALAGCASGPRATERRHAPAATARAFDDIELLTVDGKPVKLGDFAAPVTVIGLWAAWCKPCLAELPYLDQLYQSYRGDSSVSVLAVNISPPGVTPDEPARVAEEVRRLKLTLPVLRDTGLHMKRFLPAGTSGSGVGLTLPMVLFIDPGLHVFHEYGYNPSATGAYVSNARATVELARQGRLPPDRPLPKPVAGGKMSIRFKHKLSTEEIAAMRPRMKTMLEQRFPETTAAEREKMLDQIAEQAAQSDSVMIEPPRR